MENYYALTILTYLNRWDAATQRLVVDLLVVPIGDPRLPLTAGPSQAAATGQPFQGTYLTVDAHLSATPLEVPRLLESDADARFTLTPPDTQAAIFAELASQYRLTQPPVPPERERSGSKRFKKYLPTTYRSAFGFTGPSTELAVVDDSYHCARRCPPQKMPDDTPWSEEISWGDIFAMLLRQPAVARAAGLIYTVELEVGDRLSSGGWLFFTLSPDSPFAEQAGDDPNFFRYFGTRVPPLDEARPVFTPVLFPIATAGEDFGPLDEVFPEAVAFDDGFTKIVHASQAHTADHAEDGDSDFDLPLKDMGIRLGWDDESLVVRLDRNVTEKQPDGTDQPLAPTGAVGYRVDVRPVGNEGWHSLSRIRSTGLAIGDARIPSFETELMVEVHPSQIGQQFWVPAYCAYWRGRSLVADTDEQRLVIDGDAAPSPYEPIIPAAAMLRYGQDYEFRVRMVDATGGGPSIDDDPLNPAPAPIARHRFKRYVPPGRLGADLIGPTDLPTAVAFSRPGIAYPQAEFAGAPNALTRLATQARANLAADDVTVMEVPDPDAQFVELRVMVLMPRFDRSADAFGYAELYRTARAFPALDANGEESGRLTIELDWQDCAHLSDVEWSEDNPAATSPLLLPTARQVRIEARALAPEDMEYFGDDRARYGERVLLTEADLYQPAGSEPPLFIDTSASQALASVLLQPDPATRNASQTAAMQARPSPILATRLAQALDLIEDDSVLMPEAGQRAIFGCRGLKHITAPDYSSLQLTTTAELSGRWINVLRLGVDRDWSWLGYADGPFRVHRTVTLIGSGQGNQPDVRNESDLGVIGIQHTVSPHAVNTRSDRSKFTVYLVDAIDPELGVEGGLPYEMEVRYEVTAHLRTGEPQPFTVTNHLPIATPPRQIPKIVATGHAFSDYQILGDYEETGVRERVLWIEFAEDLSDPRDAYFARMLYHTPDPMLLPGTEPMADPPNYDQRPIDAELVRVIRPGQPRDLAGLSVMQRLMPCSVEEEERPRHFLLPLPPTLSPGSPELFGFFTYEFAVGHDRGPADTPLWVTAQGRFGTPLIIEGVQHPAPPLPIDVIRNKIRDEFTVVSEYARAVKEGQVLWPTVLYGEPNTEIWAIAYARVMQADGQSWRNIQLVRALAQPRNLSNSTSAELEDRKSQPVAVQARTRWSGSDMRALLEQWGLPTNTPLGFLTVELLPEPNGRFDDPIGGDLGQVRILRSSRLISGGDTCCSELHPPIVPPV